jgi:peptidoglycan/LPS O-acetylase OafA/YrhL
VQIILVLAGAVMVLRMLSTSQQRARIFGVLAIYVVLISIMVFVPGLRPKGLPAGDFNKLIATLAVWVVCVVAVELSPVQEDGYL